MVLAPETIDVSPFEVIDGQRFPDVIDGPWRYFQYQYTLRIIDEHLFGEDAEVPPLELQYHIERSLDGGSALPGRELRYVLPPHPIRVMSLVPENAEDIREPAGDTFGDAEARLFRANLAGLVASAIGVVAIGFLILALLRLVRAWQGNAPKSEKLISDAVVVRRALAELTALQNATQEQGWNPTLVGRTLAAFRLAGAAALSTPVAQEPVRSGQADREGQLTVRRGLWRPRTTALSASVTARTVSRELEHRRQLHPEDSSLSLLEGLRNAFHTFTVARYTPNAGMPTDQMTTELDRGIAAVRQLRRRTWAPVQHTTRLIGSIRGWWSDVWAR